MCYKQSIKCIICSSCANVHAGRDTHHVPASGGLLQVILLIFSVFLPFHPTCYWSGRSFYDPSCRSGDWDLRTHTEECSATLLPLLSLFFFICSQTELMIVKWWGTEGQRVQQLKITSLPLVNVCQAMAHLDLKGNGRQYCDWFELCSNPNTPMTNSESKYNPFAPCTLHPDYINTLVRCASDHAL